MIRSIVARMMAAVLLGVLVPRLGSADTVYTYNFNNLTGADAYIHGQNGWVSTLVNATGMRARGTTGVDVRAATMGTGTGAGTATAYRNSTADVAWPFVDGATALTLEWYATAGASRISRAGLANATGVPFFVIGADLSTWRFTSYTSASTTSGTIPSGYVYYDCRLVVDLLAGTASFFTRTHLVGSFAPVAGMQNMAMQLPVGFVASDFKSMYLLSRDQGAIDDIVFTVTGPPPVGEPTKISISSGNGQSAMVGTALTNPLKVLVQDVDDNPVADVSVTFAVATGGGSFASADPVLSDASGIATAPAWTLGTGAGANTATATSGTLTGSPLTFTATGTAGTATQISISAGDGQTAPVGTSVANPLKALVRDAYGNPVSGVSVTFAAATGDGSFASADPVVSGADGIATSTAWTLGPAAGANTATATSGTLTGSPLTFTATATAVPTKISISDGDGQSALVGTALANPLKALVQDAGDNPVEGVAVTFAVATGGGSFASAGAVLSGADGIATAPAWTLGAAEGVNTATATSAGLAGSPLTFAATGTVPTLFTYDFNGLTGGDTVNLHGQDGWVGSPTTGVRARGTTGVDIRAATLGSGSGTAYRESSGDSTWPFYDSVTRFTLEWYSIAGSGRRSQMGLGNASGTPFLVIGGELASWRFTSAAGINTTGGTIGPSYQYFDCRLEVDLLTGTASFSTATPGSGAWSAVSGMQDMAMQLPVDFAPSDIKSMFLRSFDQGAIDDIVITIIPPPPSGEATRISISDGNGQSGAAGTALAAPLKVLVQDAYGDPVAGVAVTFAVATGGGSFASADPVLSDASGIATAPALTLGTGVGANTATATSGTLTGSPLTFTATGTAGTATQIAISAGSGQTSPAGTALANPLKALVRDTYGNPVSGVSVTFAVATGDGSFASADPVVSGADGIATSTAWTLGPAAGANTATATSGTLAGSPLTFTATGTQTPTKISISAGNGQTADAGNTLALPLKVLVQDAGDNPVAGVTVTFAVATGGGAFAGADPVVSGADGIATSTDWTLGQQAGAQTATATSGTLTGSPLTFTATATVPPFFTYDFNHLTGGDVYLAGQDGWVGTQTLTTGMKARGTTGANVNAGTLGTGTGAQTATAYRNCSGDAAWPFDNSVTEFTLEWSAVVGNSSRISQVGLSNASGIPFFVVGGYQTTWQFASYADTVTTGGTIGAIPNSQNFDCLLSVNLRTKTASFSVDQNASGTWTPVASMQNMALELPLGFVPSDFKTLYLRSRDQGSIDDIVITNVPFVPSGSVFRFK